jgi:omega-amidase
MKEKLNITIVQTDLVWEDRTKNLEHISRLIASIQNSDIIVLPETFTSGFSMSKNAAETDPTALDWMKKMAATKKCAVAGSYFVNENGKCYNRFHFVEADGKVTIYNKKNLFRLTSEQEVFTPGNDQVVVEYHGWKISLLVCYDLRFPVWMRRTTSNEYDLILLVANWPERRSHAWNQLLIARAIENQSYVIGTNRVGKDGTGILYGGDSLGVDPMGKVIGKGNPFTEEVVQVQIEHNKLQSIRKALPLYDDRDNFKLS